MEDGDIRARASITNSNAPKFNGNTTPIQCMVLLFHRDIWGPNSSTKMFRQIDLSRQIKGETNARKSGVALALMLHIPNTSYSCRKQAHLWVCISVYSRLPVFGEREVRIVEHTTVAAFWIFWSFWKSGRCIIAWLLFTRNLQRR